MAKVKVIFEYDAAQPDELTIKVGDIISDVKKTSGGWWEGMLGGKRGVFPDNFVEDYTPPASEQPPKGPKPGTGGKVADLKNNIGGQIKMGPPPQTKSKPKQMSVVLFDYTPEQPDELALKEGEQVEVIRMAEEGWWEGMLRGKTGMFPSNFVKLMDSAPAMAASPVYPHAGAPKQNDIGSRPSTGGRPPAEKPKMLPPNEPNPPLPKRNRGVKAKVIYSYHAQNEDELSLAEGQMILVTDQKLEDPGWWKGELNGKTGVFPDNFVEVIPEDEPTQPPALPQQHASRAAAPRGASVRANKPPPPQPVEQPAELPPRPGAVTKPQASVPDGGSAPTPLLPTKPEKPAAKPVQSQPAPMMVNGVDDKAVAMLREEINRLKADMVSKESYEILQRELRANKEALETYKRESNKKMLELMKEIDEEKKVSTQNNIELARVRKLVEDKW